MVAATYDAAMVRVFADEGGYTNDPVDPGGATNFGITIIDARKYWKADARPEDVRNMPRSVAADIYRKHYATPMRYNDLPAGFDYSVLDAAINSGVGRAPVWAAKALGIAPTKNINDVVAPANAAPDKVAVIKKYWAVRLSFLQGLKTFWRFGKGWTRRCTQGEAAAVRMWLSIGTTLSSADVRKRMNEEAGKAKTSAKKSTTGAVATGGGGGAGAPSIDWDSLGAVAGKVVLAILIAAVIIGFIYFVRSAIIHNQRAAAYAQA